MPSARAQRALFLATAAGLGLLFLFLVIARSGEPLGLDQGLFACFGQWPGRLPYRDIFDSKPPLFLYTWIGFWQVGRGATGVWCVEAVWLAGSMAVAFVLARRLWGRWAGLAAAALLLIGLWSPGFGGWWSRAQAEELLALPMLGSALLAWSAAERERRALWAGVLAGVCGLYKVPALALLPAWAVFWLAACRPWRQSARRIGWLAAGAAIPWALMIAWFAAHGALGDFYQAVFVHQRNYAELIAPPFGAMMDDFATTLRDTVPALLLAAAAGLVFAWRGQRRQAWWLTPWLALTLAAVVVQRQLAGYQFLLAVPALAVCAAAGLVELTARVGSSRVDLQACKLEYSIVSPK